MQRPFHRGLLMSDALRAYLEHPYRSEDAVLARLAQARAEEPHVTVWREYAARAREVGVFAALAAVFPQLRFPIQDGISQEPAYGAATRRGKIEEAERLALELEGMLKPDDVHSGVTIGMTRAALCAAEGRDDEAEALYRSALDSVTSGYAILELLILERLVRFYRARDREEDASACEARMSELVPVTPSSTERIA